MYWDQNTFCYLIAKNVTSSSSSQNPSSLLTSFVSKNEAANGVQPIYEFVDEKKKSQLSPLPETLVDRKQLEDYLKPNSNFQNWKNIDSTSLEFLDEAEDGSTTAISFSEFVSLMRETKIKSLDHIPKNLDFGIELQESNANSSFISENIKKLITLSDLYKEPEYVKAMMENYALRPSIQTFLGSLDHRSMSKVMETFYICDRYDETWAYIFYLLEKSKTKEIEGKLLFDTRLAGDKTLLNREDLVALKKSMDKSLDEIEKAVIKEEKSSPSYDNNENPWNNDFLLQFTDTFYVSDNASPELKKRYFTKSEIETRKTERNFKKEEEYQKYDRIMEKSKSILKENIFENPELFKFFHSPNQNRSKSTNIFLLSKDEFKFLNEEMKTIDQYSFSYLRIYNPNKYLFKHALGIPERVKQIENFLRLAINEILHKHKDKHKNKQQQLQISNRILISGHDSNTMNNNTTNINDSGHPSLGSPLIEYACGVFFYIDFGKDLTKSIVNFLNYLWILRYKYDDESSSFKAWEKVFVHICSDCMKYMLTFVTDILIDFVTNLITTDDAYISKTKTEFKNSWKKACDVTNKTLEALSTKSSTKEIKKQMDDFKQQIGQTATLWETAGDCLRRLYESLKSVVTHAYENSFSLSTLKVVLKIVVIVCLGLTLLPSDYRPNLETLRSSGPHAAEFWNNIRASLAISGILFSVFEWNTMGSLVRSLSYMFPSFSSNQNEKEDSNNSSSSNQNEKEHSNNSSSSSNQNEKEDSKNKNQNNDQNTKNQEKNDQKEPYDSSQSIPVLQQLPCKNDYIASYLTEIMKSEGLYNVTSPIIQKVYNVFLKIPMTDSNFKSFVDMNLIDKITSMNKSNSNPDQELNSIFGKFYETYDVHYSLSNPFNNVKDWMAEGPLRIRKNLNMTDDAYFTSDRFYVNIANEAITNSEKNSSNSTLEILTDVQTKFIRSISHFNVKELADLAPSLEEPLQKIENIKLNVIKKNSNELEKTKQLLDFFKTEQNINIKSSSSASSSSSSSSSSSKESPLFLFENDMYNKTIFKNAFIYTNGKVSSQQHNNDEDWKENAGNIYTILESTYRKISKVYTQFKIQELTDNTLNSDDKPTNFIMTSQFLEVFDQTGIIAKNDKAQKQFDLGGDQPQLPIAFKSTNLINEVMDYMKIQNQLRKNLIEGDNNVDYHYLLLPPPSLVTLIKKDEIAWYSTLTPSSKDSYVVLKFTKDSNTYQIVKNLYENGYDDIHKTLERINERIEPVITEHGKSKKALESLFTDEIQRVENDGKSPPPPQPPPPTKEEKTFHQKIEDMITLKNKFEKVIAEYNKREVNNVIQTIERIEQRMDMLQTPENDRENEEFTKLAECLGKLVKGFDDIYNKNILGPINNDDPPDIHNLKLYMDLLFRKNIEHEKAQQQEGRASAYKMREWNLANFGTWLQRGIVNKDNVQTDDEFAKSNGKHNEYIRQTIERNKEKYGYSEIGDVTASTLYKWVNTCFHVPRQQFQKGMHELSKLVGGTFALFQKPMNYLWNYTSALSATSVLLSFMPTFDQWCDSSNLLWIAPTALVVLATGGYLCNITLSKTKGSIVSNENLPKGLLLYGLFGLSYGILTVGACIYFVPYVLSSNYSPFIATFFMYNSMGELTIHKRERCKGLLLWLLGLGTIGKLFVSDLTTQNFPFPNFNNSMVMNGTFIYEKETYYNPGLGINRYELNYYIGVTEEQRLDWENETNKIYVVLSGERSLLQNFVSSSPVESETDSERFYRNAVFYLIKIQAALHYFVNSYNIIVEKEKIPDMIKKLYKMEENEKGLVTIRRAPASYWMILSFIYGVCYSYLSIHYLLVRYCNSDKSSTSRNAWWKKYKADMSSVQGFGIVEQILNLERANLQLIPNKGETDEKKITSKTEMFSNFLHSCNGYDPNDTTSIYFYRQLVRAIVETEYNKKLKQVITGKATSQLGPFG